MTTMKGYRVTDAERKMRVGIAARNLDDLRRRTIDKFHLNDPDIDFCTTDGTLIDTEPYFQTLRPQTVLVWSRRGERIPTDADLIYRTIREVNEEFLNAGEKVQEFIGEKMRAKVCRLAEVLKDVPTARTTTSARDDDPEWFEGLSTHASTKECYMRRRGADRIRTFYYRTRTDLRRRRDVDSHRLNALFYELRRRLDAVTYNGTYLDRSAPVDRRLCDVNGRFVCGGRWDCQLCDYKHTINPYATRETRLLFQIWNYDHVIERARRIVPAIIAALQYTKSTLNISAIYCDLFTIANIRLVHIVCHDKATHDDVLTPSYLI